MEEDIGGIGENLLIGQVVGKEFTGSLRWMRASILHNQRRVLGLAALQYQPFTAISRLHASHLCGHFSAPAGSQHNELNTRRQAASDSPKHTPPICLEKNAM